MLNLYHHNTIRHPEVVYHTVIRFTRQKYRTHRIVLFEAWCGAADLQGIRLLPSAIAQKYIIVFDAWSFLLWMLNLIYRKIIYSKILYYSDLHTKSFIKLDGFQYILSVKSLIFNKTHITFVKINIIIYTVPLKTVGQLWLTVRLLVTGLLWTRTYIGTRPFIIKNKKRSIIFNFTS